MVILLDLDNVRSPSPFGLSMEQDSKFDIWRPLGGRWVRFWPWPYGKQQKDVHIDSTVLATNEMAETARREHAESIRLLYVGMTRARDYLVFAPRYSAKRGITAAWLASLTDEVGAQVFDLSRLQCDGRLVAASTEISARFVLAEPDAEMIVDDTGEETNFQVPTVTKKPVYPPYRIVPSAGDEPVGPAVKIGTVIELGGRVPLSGQPDMEMVGQATHGFLAFDRVDLGFERRLEWARAVLHRWQVSALEAGHLIEMSDCLHSYLSRAYPGMRMRTEVPIHGRRGLQRISGRIDLLLDNDERSVIIDHKTFPGSFDAWIEKARGYGLQLDLYRDVVIQATGRPAVETWIHLPIIGRMIELQSAK
jgi:ATP-dependent exoDNAse (exonuclease V) beta subunit